MIAGADAEIRASLHAGDMDGTLTLISRKVGWRICAGKIAVKLHRRSYVEFRDLR